MLRLEDTVFGVIKARCLLTDTSHRILPLPDRLACGQIHTITSLGNQPVRSRLGQP